MPACPLTKISRFTPFSELPRQELELVSRHAHRLLIPKRRWLLRPGRGLRGHHFLLKGTVATVAPAGIVSAGERAAANALYPGVGGLRTLTDCEFLQVPSEIFDLLEPMPVSPLIVVGESKECWQTHLLGSELMAPLPAGLWQHLLSRLTPNVVERGAVIIREGEQLAGSCFVLASGRANVFQSGRIVNRLKLGDLFGEDALITCEPRNAMVEMATDGQIMVLAAEDFHRFLTSALEQEGCPTWHGAGKRELIRFVSSRNLRERIDRLSTSQAYLVSSTNPRIEALALYLMRKKGLPARLAPRLPADGDAGRIRL